MPAQWSTGNFNPASAVGGFLVGAAATVLAFFAINPSSGTTANTASSASAPSNDGSSVLLPDSGGGTLTAPAVGQTKTLANGTKLTTLANGTVVATDTSGHQRVITVGGTAGSAGRTIGGTAGSAGSSGAASGSTSGGSTGGASGSHIGVGVTNGGDCKGGGSTDTGVTSNGVLLGATVAESGIAKAFLGEARQGIEAFKNRVNAAGGVCGRNLTIKYIDDGWSPSTGQQDLENLINENHVFAIAVAPSSEGVNAASAAGVFDKAGVPVVGTDGLDASQYKDPYIWPVASATVTMLHVMMKVAWAAGARHPAIVFDNQYKFGVEGAYAFDQAFKRLSGSDIPGYSNPLSGSSSCSSGSRFCGISAGTGQYGNQVSIINNACKASGSTPACDYLVLLMEPDTAEQWMATPGAPAASSFSPGGLGAAQPLFTYDFGKTCGDKCNGMQVWTGYDPPIEQFAGTQGVKQYVGDLHSQNSSADTYNQFTEGSYLGMQLLVAAMSQVGGNLTRAGLKSALDSMSLSTGLSAGQESWSPGQHWAVSGAQGFTMQSLNGFSGWRSTTPFTADPYLGQDFG